MARPPGHPRTFLEAWARERNLDKEAFIAKLLQAARQIDVDITLSDRQLGRLWGGHLKDKPHPITCRALETLTGQPIRTLLGPASNEYTESVSNYSMEDLIVTAAHESSEHALEAGSALISDITVEQLQENVQVAARTYYDLPAMYMFEQLVRTRNFTYKLLERTRRPRHQTELYLISGQISALMSSLAFDLDRLDYAMEFARAGFLYAELAEHNGLRAWTRGMQAVISYWSGRPAEAVQYALGAIEIAPPGTGVEVQVHSHLARAYAHLGAVEETEDSIRRAKQARELERRDLLDSIGGEFSCSIARQRQSHATAYLTLGMGAKAAEEAEQALRLYLGAKEGKWATIELYALADQATGYLLDNQLDACIATTQCLWVVPENQRRRGLIVRMASLRKLLAGPSLRGNDDARQLAEQIENYSSGATQIALPLA
jgi:tetratricopeptide (TPR) repeat protein